MMDRIKIASELVRLAKSLVAMKRARVYANGMDMGVYKGRDEDEVLDSYAWDAGYKNFKDLLRRVPGSSREEVDVVWL